MSTKTEERIKKILHNHFESNIQIVNERMSGVFFYGMIVGVVLSYSGFLGYVAGVGTGIMITTKYKLLAHQISDKAGFFFQNVINKIKKE